MNFTYAKTVNSFMYVPVTYPLTEPDGIYVENFHLSDAVNHINKFQVKKAFLSGITDFSFLLQCQSLECIRIELKVPFKEYANLEQHGSKLHMQYDFSALYSLPNLKYISIIDTTENDCIVSRGAIDVELLPNLQCILGRADFFCNVDKAHNLKCIWLHKLKDDAMKKVFSTDSSLETIEISSSRIINLNGISKFQKLKCLYLYRNKDLIDVSEIAGLGSSLTALRIDNCNKIADFSFLSQLKNLELLHLCGKNSLNDLSFIRNMPNLKTLILSMNVLDGDLSECTKLTYVYVEAIRRHYNVKKTDLPCGEYIRGNESIEKWRRLE